MSQDNTTECVVCGTTGLVYELSKGPGRGAKDMCIECLAIEQGGHQFSMPFEDFIDNSRHEDTPVFDDADHWHEHRELTWESARDWYTILARIKQDDPILKRDEGAIGTVHEHRREFLTNLMGSAAYYSPSEIRESDGDPDQQTLTDGGGQ